MNSKIRAVAKISILVIIGTNIPVERPFVQADPQQRLSTSKTIAKGGALTQKAKREKQRRTLFHANWKKVKYGMSRARIERLLGRPDSISVVPLFNSGHSQEIWYYGQLEFGFNEKGKLNSGLP